MTPRQREFCRHYQLGMKAADAAMAAGYARSTAERNAAAILAIPEVAIHIAGLREGQQSRVRGLMEKAFARMGEMLETGDELRVAHASRELRGWAKMLMQLGPAMNSAVAAPVAVPAADSLPDAQGFDALEDGVSAFDIRQAPRKPIPPKPEPIEISVVDYLGGQEPEVHPG